VTSKKFCTWFVPHEFVNTVNARPDEPGVTLNGDCTGAPLTDALCDAVDAGAVTANPVDRTDSFPGSCPLLHAGKSHTDARDTANADANALTTAPVE
jgi:hypothetical protein